MKFEYYGFKYETINETEVNLISAGRASGKVYIPSEVEDKEGKKYKVVGLERMEESYSYLSTLGDRRKKPYTQHSTRLVSPFKYCTSFEIFFPDTIKSIGDYAFSHCEGLISVSMPDSITKIGDYAFSHCSGLTTIEFPSKLKEIPKLCCAYCRALKTIKLPPHVERIGYSAFRGVGATEVVLPSSVSHIAELAFGSERYDGYIENIVLVQNVNILNNEGGVIVHPDAFSSRANVVYLGIPQKEPENATPKQAEAKGPAAKSIDLDKLIEAAVIDGVVTDKERSVLLRKVKEVGYDIDEAEILLDAKLYQAQQKTNKTESQQSNSKSEPQNNATKVNNEGVEIVAPKYSQAQDFENGYAAVCSGGKWGFIDKSGKEIIPTIYDDVNNFEDDKAEVTLNGKTFIVDAEGNKLGGIAGEPAPASTNSLNDTDALWASVISRLPVELQAHVSDPAGKAYFHIKPQGSVLGIKDFKYCVVYSSRASEACVNVESLNGGEEAKHTIQQFIDTRGENILSNVKSQQGTKNKNKWFWAVTTEASEFNENLVKWYVDTIVAFYRLFEVQ